MEALQIQDHDNTTSSIATLKALAPRAIQNTGSPIAGSPVAAPDVRVNKVHAYMDGVHPVSVFPFAVQDDSPVKVLHEDPYATNTGPGEPHKSICTGI